MNEWIYKVSFSIIISINPILYIILLKLYLENWADLCILTFRH